MTLIYDGTFEGFLTLIYDIYYEKLPYSQITTSSDTTDLFAQQHTVFSDTIKSQKVLDAIKTKLPPQTMQTIMNIFLCDSVPFEIHLVEFVKLGFKNANELNNINHPSVFYIQKLEKELFRHIHKMYGFTRFSELDDGFLYAKIQTKFNVVFFLGKHFAKRFNNQNYIIHDIKRKIAFFKQNNQHNIYQVGSFDIPAYSKNEEKFTQLWKDFLNNVAIKEQTNNKLQQQMVPLIYRTYMNEFF